jgi:uncharacterized damage-inducible protein DinB
MNEQHVEVKPMSISEGLLPEFDHEIAQTRKLLERIPADRFDYRPHEKSWELGELASHVANLLTWARTTIEEDVFDMDPKSMPAPPVATDAAGLVALLDENASAARAAIEGAGDATLMKEWSLRVEGQTLFTMPRIAVLRSFVMNHLIHHRGQLTVYLRQCDVPLPSIYGPTADEQ